MNIFKFYSFEAKDKKWTAINVLLKLDSIRLQDLSPLKIESTVNISQSILNRQKFSMLD